MAIVSNEAIKDWATVKPSTFALFCLLCQVKDTRRKDVYLDLPKAEQSNIKKSAYYAGFTELAEKGWIKLSQTLKGQKRWVLVKGFNVENDVDFAEAEQTQNTDSANVENNSANVENNSANVENNSANVESPPAPPIRNLIKPNKHTEPKVRERDNGIAVTDFFPIDSAEDDRRERHHCEIFNGLGERRLDTPFENPQWVTAVDYAFSREITAADFLGCIDWLKTGADQSWRTGRLTAAVVTNNLSLYLEKNTPKTVPKTRSDIDECRLCDQNGMIDFEDGVKKCSHNSGKENTQNYERQPIHLKQTAAVHPGR